jgi:hypothetical protein
MMILKTSRSNLSSNDQLSLDLPFAATKSLTARVGPTPTFTRGSGATYIGSDGLIHGVDTSTTSNTISAASKTFTLVATAGQDQFWRAGDAVEASNGSNIMVGTVTSYTPSTQSLVCNMTTVSGTGTFTSWRIGYRGPRFDHDPVTLACKGLLIEEGRKNLFSRSEDFDDVYWTKLRVSVPTPNTAISPSGSLNADKLVEDASNNTHMVYRILNTGSLAAHTFSVFAKADGRNFVYLDCGDGFPLNSNAYFNLSNGTLGTIGANATATITAFGNGWYRCSITATPTSTATNGFYIQIASANGTRFYQGDGASGIFIWGVQLEAGSFATSYIPTVASSVVRSADVCSISGANFTSFYNQSEGTIIASAFIDALAGNNRGIYGINNNTASHGFVTLYNAASSGVISQSRNTASTTLSPTFTNSSGVNFTRALAYYLGGCSIATNGSAVTDTAATISTQTMLTLQIGNMLAGSFQGTCHIPSIRYYRKRLSNAKLQALTA